ncbi:HEPN domain-containing protein [Roseibium aestuarii]|uniref:HEPN domain-containing protein n=1 Tax=Roseibium aestuarii TaxID=2600299 RepID=A0ABW4JUL6_9HYPH|nr:HEPN domain-containing protein [Roseibium aestuarii]
MTGILDFDTLKAKQRAVRSGFPETMGLRVHRSISWIGRAEACGDDEDARFLFLWIAFNAAYAEERDFGAIAPSERSRFQEFFRKLVKLDAGRRIYDAIWQRFSGPIRMLMDNRYVFSPFWMHQNGVEGFEDWQARLDRDRATFARALAASDTAQILSMVFDRLYVLRNQMMHGGTTWASSVNRTQVRDGSAILAFLMPVFIDLMMDTPDRDWGRAFYPVVE